MTVTPRRLTLILSFFTAAYLTSAPALSLDVVQQRFALFQDGYTDGAVVTGTFTGSDLDGNGILVHFLVPDGVPDPPPIALEELTEFAMHFSGNSLSPAFDLALSDLYGFVYELGTSGIGDDPAFEPTLNVNLTEGIGAIGTMRFYTSGLGPNGFVGGYVGGQISVPANLEENALDSSPNLVQVTLVPEPSSLISVAILLLAGSGRSRIPH